MPAPITATADPGATWRSSNAQAAARAGRQRQARSNPPAALRRVLACRTVSAMTRCSSWRAQLPITRGVTTSIRTALAALAIAATVVPVTAASADAATKQRRQKTKRVVTTKRVAAKPAKPVAAVALAPAATPAPGRRRPPPPPPSTR